MTDKLADELRAAFPIGDGETIYPGHPKEVAHRAAAELDRRAAPEAVGKREEWSKGWRPLPESKAERDSMEFMNAQSGRTMMQALATSLYTWSQLNPHEGSLSQCQAIYANEVAKFCASLRQPAAEPSEAEVEAVARALWEDWRKAKAAKPLYRNISWDDLLRAAPERPKIAELIEAGRSQARAAIRAARATAAKGE